MPSLLFLYIYSGLQFLGKSSVILEMSSLLILAFATLFGCLVSNVNGATASASACSTSLTPTNSIQPTVASGYQMALIATGLTKPRSMQFDSAGNLLVVQQGTGIVNLVLQDEGRTCLSVKSSKNVIENKSVCCDNPNTPQKKKLTFPDKAQPWYRLIRRWQDTVRLFRRSSILVAL